MNLTIIIPFYNEKGNFKKVISKFEKDISASDYEVLFINDYSCDEGEKELDALIKNKKNYILIKNKEKKGLGGAIRTGILNSKGFYVAIMMCDLSDTVEDLNRYYNEIINSNYDAILGTRFGRDSRIKNYPKFKFFLNRIFNLVVKGIFFSNYNDFTNAFKIYKKKILNEITPIVSEDFNIFLEIPLKIIYRGYNYKIISISWYGREKGKSKFKFKELRSKYLFTLLYCFFEKVLLKRSKFN